MVRLGGALESFNRWTLSEAPACVSKKLNPNTSDIWCRKWCLAFVGSFPVIFSGGHIIWSKNSDDFHSESSWWLCSGGETADAPDGVVPVIGVDESSTTSTRLFLRLVSTRGAVGGGVNWVYFYLGLETVGLLFWACFCFAVVFGLGSCGLSLSVLIFGLLAC